MTLTTKNNINTSIPVARPASTVAVGRKGGVVAVVSLTPTSTAAVMVVKLPIASTLTISLLTPFHSSTTLLEKNLFLPVFFLNLNLPSFSSSSSSSSSSGGGGGGDGAASQKGCGAMIGFHSR